MSSINSAIKDLETDQTKLNEFFEQSQPAFNKIEALAEKLGTEIVIDEENYKDCLELGHFVRVQIQNFPLAIKIYLEILKEFGYVSEIYRILCDIYFYDLETVWEFPFLDNALEQFSNPDLVIHPTVGVDPIFLCMSYTYIGRLYERLGKMWNARSAYNIVSQTWHDERRSIAALAEYQNAELDFMCGIGHLELSFESSSKNSKKNNKLKSNLVITSVFFGRVYTKLFMDGALPSFFCEKNLKVLKNYWNPVLVIFCPLADRYLLEKNKNFKALNTKINVEVISFPKSLLRLYPERPNKGEPFHPVQAYSIAALSQLCAADLARRHKADFINLPPDCIFSNEAANKIYKTARKNGKEVLFTPGIRLSRENVREKYLDNDKNVFSAQELLNICMENLHPATKATFVNDTKVTYPGMLWSPIGKKGLLGHCFQMHPIFVGKKLISESNFRRFESIDGDFIHSLVPEPRDWNLIEVDSPDNQPIMFELSDEKIPAALEFFTKDLPLNAKHWIAGVMRPINFWLFQHEIRIGDTEGKLSKESKECIEKIKRGVKTLGTNIPVKTKIDLSSITENQKSEYLSLINNWAAEEEKGENKKQTYVRGNKKRHENKPEDLRILFCLVLWGEEYVENFLNYCLPSMLADGNLNGLTNNSISTFQIRTTLEDQNRLQLNPAFRHLESIIKIEFIELDPKVSMNKYFVLSQAQSMAIHTTRSKIEAASSDDYQFHYDVIFFLYSDFVWAKGSIKNTIKRLSEGYEGVLTPVPPLVLESFQDMIFSEHLEHNPYLEDKYVKTNEELPKNLKLTSEREFGYVIDLNPRDLVRLGKQILHPMMRDNIIDYEIHTGNPAYVLWLGPNDDLLIRCFHAHPVAVRVQQDNPLFYGHFNKTLDEFFLPRVFTSLDRLYFVEDSDELAMVSLTEASFPVPIMPKGHFLDATYIARWAEAAAAPLHKYMFSRKTFWHSEELNIEEWETPLRRSALTVDEVRFKLTLPAVLSLEDPLYFGVREQRRERFEEEIAAIEKYSNQIAKENRSIKKIWHTLTLGTSRFLYQVLRIIFLPFGSRGKKLLRALLPKRINRWIEFRHRDS